MGFFWVLRDSKWWLMEAGAWDVQLVLHYTRILFSIIVFEFVA